MSVVTYTQKRKGLGKQQNNKTLIKNYENSDNLLKIDTKSKRNETTENRNIINFFKQVIKAKRHVTISIKSDLITLFFSARKMKETKIKYNQNTVNISTLIVNVFHQLKQYVVSLLNISSRSAASISSGENTFNWKDINSGTNHTKLMTQNSNEACANKRKENNRFASMILR